jgi:hypothetical protein
MNPNTTTPRSAQRGAASLVVAMVLLFGMTMVAFYANRGLLFEQKTSANQYRATSAFEVAEAGIEWATARLNEPQKIDASCGASAGVADKTFRDKYLQHTTIPTFNPAGIGTVRPGCRFPAIGAPVCSCPDLGNPSLGTASEPRFAVEFGLASPETVVISSIGCTAGTKCIPGDTASDATARIRVIVKLLPTLRSDPKAALTAGGDVTLGGTTDNIVNNDVATNFRTVSAATLRITWPGAPVIPVTTPDPPANAVFRAYFGQDMADYKANAATTVICDAGVYGPLYGPCPAGTIACTGGPACAAAVVSEIARGRTQFWVDAALEFTNANVPVEVGNANNPVLIATPFGITFSGNTPLYGVLFGAGQSWDIQGLGTTEVRGAIIARNDFNSTGNFTLRYDPAVLQKLRPAAGTMVRVPGSWNDL